MTGSVGSRWFRLVTQLMMVFGAALALAACSSSTPAGVLTQSDLPSYLGVRTDQHASVAAAGSVRTVTCKAVTAAVFNGSWKQLHSGPASIPVAVTSVSLSCQGVSQAQRYFNTIKVGAKGYPVPAVKGYPVSGLGDEAWLIDAGHNADLREYSLAWRQGNRVDLVQVEGPLSDKRITRALVELLARRAAARS